MLLNSSFLSQDDTNLVYSTALAFTLTAVLIDLGTCLISVESDHGNHRTYLQIANQSEAASD